MTVPQYKKYLRVAGAKDEEIRCEKIEINEEALKELGDRAIAPDRLKYSIKNNVETV